MVQELLLAGFGAAAGAAISWWLWGRGPRSRDDSFVSLRRELADRLDGGIAQIDRRLRENVQAMNESKSFLAARVSGAERTVREVSSGLGKLEQATAALQRTNDEIATFQRLLTSPKVRGSFGEVLLLNLLADVLPADRYVAQFTLPGTSEIADAIIRLQDGYIVAVDAKFPLAHYQVFMNEPAGASREAARAAFIRDIKKHITDISRKYIAPAAKTLDYAFMYIPIEGVYYETMVRGEAGESLWEFCLRHKVVPVSPNSFLAYLQTVLVGLRGMKVQQQTREILEGLGQVRRDFQHFAEDFSMVGKHLGNAKNRFDDSARRLDKFSNRLEQIETISAPPTASLEAEVTVSKGSEG